MHYLLQNFSHISDSFHLFRWFEWSFDGEFDKHYLITVCDIAWSNLPQQVLDRLQQLQNRSARIITCCSRSGFFGQVLGKDFFTSAVTDSEKRRKCSDWLSGDWLSMNKGSRTLTCHLTSRLQSDTWPVAGCKTVTRLRKSDQDSWH